ncbi:MAG TPA: hypothetical protein VFU31_10300, partial [Candidatus Binatia bacterium]|nr:hypothetical protein [Candidatus Binatia bacterium]
SIAGKLAEIFNLKSTGIIVNQNATSTQYLSFRYFLAGEPFRYFDGSIGLDQTEIVFYNPATVPELVGELGKVWRVIFKNLRPNITSNYVEATLHCDTNGSSTKAFLNDLVEVRSDALGIHKGFSLTSKTVDAVARISLDVSDSVADGLYVVFAYVSTGSVRDMLSFERLFDATLTAYRSLQSLAQIELVEPT